MEFKIDKLVNTDAKSKVALPIIADCSIGYKINKKLNIDDELYVNSTFYQTSKMICYSFYKPLHIKSTNDK